LNEAIRKLGIRYPIVQGPFGGGFSTPQLAATVANKGGLGSYGAHHLAPQNITRVIQEIRAQTGAAFAVNLWISDHDAGGEELTQRELDRYFPLFARYFDELGVAKPEPPAVVHHRFADQVEALIEARPPVFSFVFGVPSASILDRCRKNGILTAGAATSIAEALALDAAGVDLIVASGFEGGGHRPSFLARAEDSLLGTFALTQLIAPRVKVPVVAAGGIVDARGIRAALALGAQAAQIGTAFLACRESAATDAHRDVLFSAQAQNTQLTRAYSGRLARGVQNRWMQEMAPLLDQIPPFPIQGWFTSKLRPAAVAAGRTDLVSLWAGQSAPNIKHRSAAALMDELIADLEKDPPR